MPTTITITNSDGINHLKICAVITISLPDNWLKSGSNAQASSRAITVEASVTSADSDKNCATRYPRGEPKTLRTPTSRARLADLAVERFMKLTQASISTKMAMAEYI